MDRSRLGSGQPNTEKGNKPEENLCVCVCAPKTLNPMVCVRVRVV